MPRYFIEVSYKGTRYSGSQIQQNANSIQAEIERALHIFYKDKFHLTGSSRTDAGVHAIQNFFHFDIDDIIFKPQDVYNINDILPFDIVVKNIMNVQPQAHCRFDAIAREYSYYIYQCKDPFLMDKAFYFPYKINLDKLKDAAQQLLYYSDFTSFSKKRSQVNNFKCTITEVSVLNENGLISFNITGNRFLRGMVRGIVATLLKVATEKITINYFIKIIESREPALADFSVPAHGLFLAAVHFPPGIFFKEGTL